ncbi:PREDICTED: uncharacterized protein LOC105153052 [Acromyrmex echinatior]|nr:PREDICTED: uncharacterized protein LOC105153052 [Acromyrmex echinatior]
MSDDYANNLSALRFDERKFLPYLEYEVSETDRHFIDHRPPIHTSTDRSDTLSVSSESSETEDMSNETLEPPTADAATEKEEGESSDSDNDEDSDDSGSGVEADDEMNVDD